MVLLLLCDLVCLCVLIRFQKDPTWSETGDRYLLKLFRDHLFHQVTEAGMPWIDLSHIVSCLNKVSELSSFFSLTKLMIFKVVHDNEVICHTCKMTYFQNICSCLICTAKKNMHAFANRLQKRESKSRSIIGLLPSSTFGYQPVMGKSSRNDLSTF